MEMEETLVVVEEEGMEIEWDEAPHDSNKARMKDRVPNNTMRNDDDEEIVGEEIILGYEPVKEKMTKSSRTFGLGTPRSAMILARRSLGRRSSKTKRGGSRKSTTTTVKGHSTNGGLEQNKQQEEEKHQPQDFEHETKPNDDDDDDDDIIIEKSLNAQSPQNTTVVGGMSTSMVAATTTTTSSSQGLIRDDADDYVVITASVHKESHKTTTGIRFKRRQEEENGGQFYISHIEGLFAATELQLGDEIVSVNNDSCAGKSISQLETQIKNTVGILTVLVIRRNDADKSSSPNLVIKDDAVKKQRKRSRLLRTPWKSSSSSRSLGAASIATNHSVGVSLASITCTNNRAVEPNNVVRIQPQVSNNNNKNKRFNHLFRKSSISTKTQQEQTTTTTTTTPPVQDSSFEVTFGEPIFPHYVFDTTNLSSPLSSSSSSWSSVFQDLCFPCFCVDDFFTDDSFSITGWVDDLSLVRRNNRDDETLATAETTAASLE